MIETYIKVNGEFEQAWLTYATPNELAELDLWKEEYKDDTSQNGVDTVEYTEDSLKKRKNYAFYGRCPESFESFLGIARLDEANEIGGLFVLKCPILADVTLGFVFVRRTYTKNLVLDYLVPRPKSTEYVTGHTVTNIGGGLFAATCELALLFEANLLRWETSLESVGFYMHLLKRTDKRDSYELSRREYVDFLTSLNG